MAFTSSCSFFLSAKSVFLSSSLSASSSTSFGSRRRRAELRGDLLVLLNVQQELREVAAFERLAALALHDVLFGGALHQLAREFALVADVAVHLAALDAIERRLGDVDVLLLDQLAHVAEEKREQQRADVAAVDVRVGHQDDFVVAELAGVEIILADAGAERGDDARISSWPSILS